MKLPFMAQHQSLILLEGGVGNFLLDEEVGGQITYINKYIYDLNSTLQSFV
jgi:hypothetical protein